MWRHDDFERLAMRIFHELLVACLEVFVPVFFGLHPVGFELELRERVFGVDVTFSLLEQRAFAPGLFLFPLEIIVGETLWQLLRFFTAFQEAYILVEPIRPARLIVVCTC